MAGVAHTRGSRVLVATSPSGSFVYLLTASHAVHLAGGTARSHYALIAPFLGKTLESRRILLDVTLPGIGISWRCAGFTFLRCWNWRDTLRAAQGDRDHVRYAVAVQPCDGDPYEPSLFGNPLAEDRDVALSCSPTP